MFFPFPVFWITQHIRAFGAYSSSSITYIRLSATPSGLSRLSLQPLAGCWIVGWNALNSPTGTYAAYQLLKPHRNDEYVRVKTSNNSICRRRFTSSLRFTSLVFSRAVLATNSHNIQVYCPHMPIGKVWIYRLLFVCVFSVCLYDCAFLRRGQS